MSAIGAGAGGTSGTASAGAEPGDGAGTGRSLRVDAFAPQSVWALAAGRPLLARFNEAGVLAAADVHVALRLGALTGEQDERVLLAVALGVCAVRTGSVCTTLEDAPALADAGRASSPDPAMVLGVPAWPDLPDWREALLASPMIAVGHEGPADRPVRWVDGRIYLDRYWRDEQVVRTEVDARLAEPLGSGTDREDAIAAVARQLFPAAEQDRQRVAAATTALSRITVLTGGPGTGKTTTVARIVALVQAIADQFPGSGSAGPAVPGRDGPGTDRPGTEAPGTEAPGTAGALRVALAAPTGKAAARLQEAVNGEVATLPAEDRERVGVLRATTIHRLLGSRPGSSTRFRHDREHRLPHDLVVVDESSMVSLPLMARLLESLRPHARLLLIGDPDQLASVEAGAVLGDLVARPPVADWLPARLRAVLPDDVTAAGPAGEVAPALDPSLGNGVVRLVRTHRYSGDLARLAEAIRAADEGAVLAVLHAGGSTIEFAELDDERPGAEVPGLRSEIEATGTALAEAAEAGDAAAALVALGRHRLLLAHRLGPAGVAHWAAQAAAWVSAVTGAGPSLTWPPGLPLLVTENDRASGLSNGDTGVVIRDRAADDAGLLVAFGEPDHPRLVRPHRLPQVQPVHAMTVHRAQGSQFTRVSVVLPPSSSPLLTRELFYTAVTRAREGVRIAGSEQAVRLAVRRPIRRASGLREPG